MRGLLQGMVQQWLGKYQDTAVEYAQQGYDQMQEYVRSNFNDYVEANNLTQVKPAIATMAHPACLLMCIVVRRPSNVHALSFAQQPLIRYAG